ncbi:MAG: DUF4157 domain-containing protein [Myxococcota bacterium]
MAEFDDGGSTTRTPVQRDQRQSEGAGHSSASHSPQRATGQRSGRAGKGGLTSRSIQRKSSVSTSSSLSDPTSSHSPNTSARGVRSGGSAISVGDEFGGVLRSAGSDSEASSAAGGPVQMAGGQPGGQVHAIASQGLSGSSGQLPHLSTIQASFGRHDVSGIKAHTDQRASDANTDLGARGFASGEHVAFKGAPDLHTAAHEAAHVVQQRAGVYLKGGVGQDGDIYEQHADRVADAVVAGRSAEGLLDTMAPAAADHRSVGAGAVQRDGDDSEDKLPSKVTVNWGGDPFEVSFAVRGRSSYDRKFVVTAKYTGPHLVDGPFVRDKSKELSTDIGSRAVKAGAAVVKGTQLSVDLYGDGRQVVSLVDKHERMLAPAGIPAIGSGLVDQRDHLPAIAV